MKYARLVLRNLSRTPWRTLSTILAVAGALFIFSVLASLPGVAEQFLGAAASPQRLVVRHRAGVSYLFPEPIGVAVRDRVSQLPHVEAVVAESWFGGTYESPTDDFPNTSIDPEHIEHVWPDWEISPAAMAEFKRVKNAALVGKALLARFNWSVGQEVTLRGTNYPIDVPVKIVGTLGDKAIPTYLVFRRDHLHALAHGDILVDNLWIRIDKPEAAAEVIARVERESDGTPDPLKVVSEAEFVRHFFSNLDDLFSLAGMFAVLVVVAAAVVLAMITAMSLGEREREISRLRSLGFGRGLTIACLTAEATVVGLVGGLLGALGCYAVMRWATVGFSEFGQLGVIGMPSSVLVQSLLIALLIGPLSGILPGRAAAGGEAGAPLRMTE